MRIRPPVDKEYRLFAGGKRGRKLRVQHGPQDGRFAFLEEVSQVGERYLGELRSDCAALQFDQLKIPGEGPMIGFEGRSGRTEDQRSACASGSEFCEIADMISRRAFLLIAAFVLFVHDDEAKIGERREDRAARADNERGRAFPRSTPVAQPFTFSKGRMHDGHSLAKALPHLPDDLRRQRNFGNEIQGLLSSGERFLDSAKIHFRLAAARHSVQ